MQQSPYQPHHYHQQPQLQPQSFPDQMVVDYPPRRMTGFNPALLNPILPSPNFQGQSFPSQPNTDPFNFPMAPDPFPLPATSPILYSASSSAYVHDTPAGEDTHASSTRSFPIAQCNLQGQAPPPPPERFPTPLPEASSSSSAVAPDLTPMVVERSLTAAWISVLIVEALSASEGSNGGIEHQAAWAAPCKKKLLKDVREFIEEVVGESNDE